MNVPNKNLTDFKATLIDYKALMETRNTTLRRLRYNDVNTILDDILLYTLP